MSIPLSRRSSAPTIQRFLGGAGTYNKPADCTWIRVMMVGAGGGGGGGGTAPNSTPATAGGDTTFGTSLIIARGGGLGDWKVVSGSGGTPTVNAPAIAILAIEGADGAGGGEEQAANTAYVPAGAGASSFFGGGGSPSGWGPFNGSPAKANTGSGGSGGGTSGNTVGNNYGGSGGCAGAYICAQINSPDASYPYSVGVRGTGGIQAGAGTFGGDGADGQIIVEEHYD